MGNRVDDAVRGRLRGRGPHRPRAAHRRRRRGEPGQSAAARQFAVVARPVQPGPAGVPPRSAGGLGSWGIRTFSGHQWAYLRSLDGFYERLSAFRNTPHDPEGRRALPRAAEAVRQAAGQGASRPWMTQRFVEIDKAVAASLRTVAERIHTHRWRERECGDSLKSLQDAFRDLQQWTAKTTRYCRRAEDCRDARREGNPPGCSMPRPPEGRTWRLSGGPIAERRGPG